MYFQRTCQQINTWVLLLMLSLPLQAQLNNLPGVNSNNLIRAKVSANVNPLRAFTRFQEWADNAYAEANYEKAFKYYHRLARFGDKFAQYRMATMHMQGLGVPVNIQEAYAWSAVAAESPREAYTEYQMYIREQLNEKQLERAQAIAAGKITEMGNYAMAIMAKKQLFREKMNCTTLADAFFGRGCGIVVCNGFNNAIPSRRCMIVGSMGLSGFENIPPDAMRDLRASVDHMINIYSPGRVEFGELELLED